MRSSEAIREALFDFIQLLSIAFFSSYGSINDHHVKKILTALRTRFLLKKEGRGKKKKQSTHYLVRVCSLSAVPTRRDERGAAPACAESLPPQPRLPSAQGHHPAPARRPALR